MGLGRRHRPPGGRGQFGSLLHRRGRGDLPGLPRQQGHEEPTVPRNGDSLSPDEMGMKRSGPSHKRSHKRGKVTAAPAPPLPTPLPQLGCPPGQSHARLSPPAPLLPPVPLVVLAPAACSLPAVSEAATSTSPSSTTSPSAWRFTPSSSSTSPPWTCCARLSRSSSSSPSRPSSSSPSGKVGPPSFSSRSTTQPRDEGPELTPLPSPVQGRCWQSWRSVG